MDEREATTNGGEIDHGAEDGDEDDSLTDRQLLDAIIIAAVLAALATIVVLIFATYLRGLLSVGTAIYAAFLVALLGFISLPILLIRPLWVKYRYKQLLEREEKDLRRFRKQLSCPSRNRTAEPTSEACDRLNNAIETIEDLLKVLKHPILLFLQNDVAFLSNYYWANRQKVYALNALDRLGIDPPIERPETGETTDGGLPGAIRRFRFSHLLRHQIGEPTIPSQGEPRLPTVTKWVRSSAERALPEGHRKEIDGYLKGKSAEQKVEAKDCCKKCCCCKEKSAEDDEAKSANASGNHEEGSIDPYGLYMAVSALQSWEVGQVSRMLSVRRYLQLLIYFGALLLIVLVGLIGPSVDEFLIQTAIVATVAGMLGALFSLALPFGKREFTLTSESSETQPAVPPATIIVESILVRVVIGGIAGVVVISFLGLSSWDWIFAPEVAALVESPEGRRASSSTLVFAFVGGFSERLVDSLIARVEERFGVETGGKPEAAETPEASD